MDGNWDPLYKCLPFQSFGATSRYYVELGLIVKWAFESLIIMFYEIAK